VCVCVLLLLLLLFDLRSLLWIERKETLQITLVQKAFLALHSLLKTNQI